MAICVPRLLAGLMVVLAALGSGAPARAACAADGLPAGAPVRIAPSNLTNLLQKRAQDVVLSAWTGRYLVVMGRYVPFEAAVYDACTGRWATVPEWPGGARLGTTLVLMTWSGRRAVVTAVGGRAVVELDPASRTWSAPGAETEKTLVMSPSAWRWYDDPSRSVTAFDRAIVEPPVRGHESRPLLANPPAPRQVHLEQRLPDRVMVWGGMDNQGGVLSDGAVLDVKRRYWRRMATAGAPVGRVQMSSAWTGQRLAVWGGWRPRASENARECLTDGGIYDPARDRWTPIASTNAPSARERHVQVVDGDRVYVFGGFAGCGSGGSQTPLRDGAVLDVVRGKWTRIELPGPISADPTYPPRPSGYVLSQRRVLVRGESGPWMYDPKDGSVRALPDALSGRWLVTGVAGDRLLVWGRIAIVMPGGGCDGPRHPNQPGCDPMPAVVAYHDEGWLLPN